MYLYTCKDSIVIIAYLVDIFEHINSLIVILQEKNSTILDFSVKLKPFDIKIELWINKINLKKVVYVKYFE